MSKLFSQETEEVLSALKRALTQEGLVKPVKEVKPKTEKKSALQSLRESLEPIGDNSQASFTNTDVMNTFGGEGGGGQCECHYCQKWFPENAVLNVQVSAFQEGHACHECAKANGKEQLDFWDEWQTWNA